MNIDTKHYAIIGYGRVPQYRIPAVATPHIIEYGMSRTLCEKLWSSLHNRETERGAEPWKHPVCSRCNAALNRQFVPPMSEAELHALSQAIALFEATPRGGDIEEDPARDAALRRAGDKLFGRSRK